MNKDYKNWTIYIICIVNDIFCCDWSLADRHVDAKDSEPLLENGASTLVQGNLAEVQEP